MKKIVPIILTFLLITSCKAQQNTITKNDNKKDLKEIVNHYQDSLTEKEYGLVALLRKDGVTQITAIGISEPTKKMTTNKIFNIGSLTKMFTSVLILQEVEKGKLNLNDTIGFFFPKDEIYNKNVDTKITIENLLRHESGLGEIVVDSIVNQAFSNPFHDYNNTFLFKKTPKPVFKKGKDFKYTNTNYILLGYILELINDKPYSDILKERIFEPCEMKNTYAYFSKSIPNSAHPMYDKQDLYEYVNYKYYKNYGFSAGSISSNIIDLKKFFIALYETNILISKETFAKMTTFRNNYGLGIEQIPTPEKDIFYIGHGGDNLSFTTRNFYNPKSKVLVITLSNHLYDKYCWKIGNKILSEFDNK